MTNRPVLVNKSRVTCGKEECREVLQGESRRRSEVFGGRLVWRGGSFIRAITKKDVGQELNCLWHAIVGRQSGVAEEETLQFLRICI